MRDTKLSERFFESTRGRIVALLRANTATVNELAQSLGLTDNAVRAHLLTLERDGLVQQSGVQKGTRKPHYAYELAPEADELFPKAYDALFNQLVTVLKGHLTPAALKEALREVGRSLADRHTNNGDPTDLEARVQNALSVLRAIGGSPSVVNDGEQISIVSRNCPLSAAVAAHPEVCQLAEALVAEIVRRPVREHCDRTAAPKCCFELAAV